MIYRIDLREKVSGDTFMTIFRSDDYDTVWDVANTYNRIHGITEEEHMMLETGETEGWTSHPFWASVYEDCGEVFEPEIEEEKEMKKYTIENYKEFSREALDAPPIEEFEDGTIDESKWYEENKIIITKGKHQMELDYNADNVNELDGALREMYEVEMDIRSATTGNTVGNQYRPAELKDIIRIAIQNDWGKDGWRMGDFSTFIRHFINQIKDINDVMNYYKIIQEDYKDATDRCKCDFSKLDMSTMRINPKTIRDTISELICTDRELLYGVTEDNKSSDIVFVMDYTLKLSGELIGWFYGEPDDEYIDELIVDYKKKLFGEEN